MSNKLEAKDLLTVDNLVKINAVTSLLMKKNIFSKEEIEEEMKSLSERMAEEINRIVAEAKTDI